MTAMSSTTVITTGTSGCPLTVVGPAGGEFVAAVIVLQEAWGVTPHLISQGASLAQHGFLAVLPHLFHRAGDPVLDGGDFEAAKPYVFGLTGDGISADVGDAARHARDLGARRLGVVGFCMGGTAALWATARAGVDAGVTFYGSGIREGRWPGIPSGLELAGELQVPWLGLYGDQDPTIPVEQVEALRAVVGQRPVPTDVVRYPDAGHAFATDPESPRRHEAAAQDGWARAITWFEAHLK